MPEPSARASRPQWHKDDLAFAIAAIKGEFPSRSAARLSEAVSRGAMELLPPAGRVKLVQHVRKMLREST